MPACAASGVVIVLVLPPSPDQTKKYIDPSPMAIAATQRQLMPCLGREDMYCLDEPARGVCELSTMMLTFLAGVGQSLAWV